MITTKHLYAFTAILACSSLAPAQASVCEVQSGIEQARVVELYTSEGCSSCPPADRWLNAIEPAATLIPLAFHVDYWDYLGWRDEFANPLHAQRQRKLAARGGSGVVYTPQLAINGREFRGWGRGLPAATDSAATVGLHVRVAQPDPARIEARVTVSGSYPAAARLWLALAQSELTTEVRAGENRGKRLQHDHVVRVLSGPHPLNQGALALTPPDRWVAADSHLVAWVEDADSGRYLQAVRLGLGASCAGRSGEWIQ